jgi:hypothetical protein
MREQILRLYENGEELSAAEAAGLLGPQYGPGGSAEIYFNSVFLKIAKSGAIIEVRRGVFARPPAPANFQQTLF